MTTQNTAAIEAYKAKQRANWTCEICGVKHGEQRMLREGHRMYNVHLMAIRTVRDGQPALVVACERCRNKVPRQEQGEQHGTH